MTEWRGGNLEDLTTEELVAQARVPDTSYPHKAQCAYILADRIECLSGELLVTFQAGYGYGMDDAKHNYPPRTKGAYNEWRKVTAQQRLTPGD